MYVSEKLRPDHDLDAFDSGVHSLDNWLRAAALDQANRRYSNTFVWDDDGAVRAYYTIAGHRVSSSEFPSKETRGGPGSLPAVLLAKLALDRSLHRKGLGGQLLLDAMTRVVAHADEGPGARVVMVDAIDESAAEFYKHYGFKPVAGSEMTLYRRLSDIAADLP